MRRNGCRATRTGTTRPQSRSTAEPARCRAGGPRVETRRDLEAATNTRWRPSGESASCAVEATGAGLSSTCGGGSISNRTVAACVGGFVEERQTDRTCREHDERGSQESRAAADASRSRSRRPRDGARSGRSASRLRRQPNAVRSPDLPRSATDRPRSSPDTFGRSHQRAIGASGCSAVTGGGSRSRMAAMRLACVLASNALLPVSIS